MSPGALSFAVRNCARAIALVAATSLLVALLSASSPVQAASSGNFFNDFMGIFSGQSGRPRRQANAPIQVPGYGAPKLRERKSVSLPSAGSGGASFGGGSEQSSNDESRPRRRGGLRTMCVRLCDGFYWPVSNSASGSDLANDNRACESSCMAPAKLFYQTDGGIDPARMRSLDGKSYKKLDTAFLYRKALQPSCRCKADPWSVTEEMRHRGYARTTLIGPDTPIASQSSLGNSRAINFDMMTDPPAAAATLVQEDDVMAN